MIDPIASLLGDWATGLTPASIIFRALIAILFAAVIGCARAAKRHAAGLRTFMLVSLASAMAAMADEFVCVKFGADMALISMNKWYRMDDSGDLNLDGVSGALFPLPVSDQELTSILPTGWRQNIQTVTLTGKRVKELAETGYDRSGDGEHSFPYALVTPEGFVIDDDAVYTVAIAVVTDEVAEEGDLTDTGRRADRADGLSGAAQHLRFLSVRDDGRGRYGALLHAKRNTGHAHGPELSHGRT